MAEQRPLPPLTPGRTPEHVNMLLEQLRQQPCHLLTSVVRVDSIPSMHEIAFHVLKFNPIEGQGDVWHDKKWAAGEVALTHDALMRLWNGAGGQFVESFAQSQETHCIEWKCAGRIREMGGMWTTEWASRRIDLRDGSAEAKGQSTGQLEQQRRDIYQLAESKSQNRVVRKLLGIRQKYSAAEAAWPFIIIRPMLVVNMEDPMQKALYLADAMGSLNALFGNGDFMKFLTVGSTPDLDPSKALPAAPPQSAITAGNPPQQQVPPAGWQQPQEQLAKGEVKLTLEQSVEAFGGLSHQGQIDELERLVKQKNYDLGKLKTNIRDLTNDAPKYWRRTFYANLWQMPDAPAEEESPFKL